MVVPPFTHTWIEPGKVLIGSIPSMPQNIDTLADMGIEVILTLTRRDIRDYPGVSEALDSHKIGLLHYPIPDGGIPAELVPHDALWFIHDSQTHRMPIYVHCRGGIGRSGIILQAYYCLKVGKTIEEARDLLRVRRNYEGNATAADQGSPQREWLEQLVASKFAKEQHDDGN